MGCDPHLCLAIILGPQPDSYQVKFLTQNSRLSLVSVGPFLKLFVASGTTVFRHKISGGAREGMPEDPIN